MRRKRFACSVVLTLFAACDDRRSTAPAIDASTGATSASVDVRLETASSKPRPTTRSTIAIRGLDNKISELENRLKRFPKQALNKPALIGLLSSRASALGRVSDLERIVELADQLATEPANHRNLLARAQAYGHVHQFEKATALLDQLDAKQKSPTQSSRKARGVILMALGKTQEAFAHLRQEGAGAVFTTSSLGLEAMALAKLGRYDEAEGKFKRAETIFRGVSPFVLAWLRFQRGSMWDHAGHGEKAQIHYRRALYHLPEHAHAVSHLAGYLSANEAEGMYERLLKTSDDPEHRAALGMLKNRRRAGSGDVLVAEAKSHYLKLMKTLPLAFADHAGWFWLGIGADPIRALEVASLNLDARRTPEAFSLKIASLLAVGDKDAACETAEDAVTLEPQTPGLLARCADAFDACGRSLRAEEMRQGR